MLELDTAGAMNATLTVSQITLTDNRDSWTDIVMSCPDISLGNGSLGCPLLQVSAMSRDLGQQRFSGQLEVSIDGSAAVVALEGGSLAGSTMRLDGELDDGRWEGKIRLPGIRLDRFLKLLALYLPELPMPELTGIVAAELEVTGAGADPDRAVVAIAAREVTGGNAAGTVATDSLKTTVRIEAEQRGETWSILASQRADSGQAYAEPIFLDLAAQPQQIEIGATLDPARGVVKIDSWTYRQNGVVDGEGSATVLLTDDGARIDNVHCEHLSAQLPAAFDTYALPFLFATPLDALDTAGTVALQFALHGTTPVAFTARLSDVSVADKSGRFGFSGAEGQVHWSEPAVVPDWPERSVLAWNDALLAQLPAGAAKIEFVAQGRDFRLAAPLQLPLLDGRLALNRLDVLDAGGEKMALMLDAELEPISLTELTTTLGWPIFAGNLSGRLPSLSYRDGVVELGGKLEAEVFGGSLQIDGLRVVQPLGNLPQLFADVRFDGLDLETLTETFSFGRITGHVDGEISGLHMLQWEPVAFDATLKSTATETRKRRISQRAVENISSVSGGGAAAALSSGVMAFFDDFAYAALGIRCRLENGICNMDGIGAANNGYYIVRGKGLPRIDVIGYAGQVDWARLVEQLKAIQQSGAPTTGAARSNSASVQVDSAQLMLTRR